MERQHLKLTAAAHGIGRPSEFTKQFRARMFLALAIEFRALSGTAGRSPAFAYVKLFLIGRGLELALKAFLLSRGWTESEVKKEVGHSLTRGIAAAGKAGLSLPQINRNTETEIHRFDRLYRTKRFEYFSALELLLPSTTEEYSATVEYASAVHDEILKATLKSIRLEDVGLKNGETNS